MADIDIARSHSLGLEGGHAAVERVARELRDDLGVEYRWEDYTLQFNGQGADGRIEVEEGLVRVFIDLPLFLQPMRSRIRAEAEKYLNRHLENGAE